MKKFIGIDLDWYQRTLESYDSNKWVYMRPLDSEISLMMHRLEIPNPATKYYNNLLLYLYKYKNTGGLENIAVADEFFEHIANMQTLTRYPSDRQFILVRQFTYCVNIMEYIRLKLTNSEEAEPLYNKARWVALAALQELRDLPEDYKQINSNKQRIFFWFGCCIGTEYQIRPHKRIRPWV